MRNLGVISVAGILFFLMCAQTVPSGYSDVIPTREGHGQRIRRLKKKIKPLRDLCSEKTGLTKRDLKIVALMSKGDFKPVYRKICSKHEGIRECVKEHLNNLHNCGPQHSNMISILVDKAVTYICENDGSLLSGFFPEENPNCSDNVSGVLLQCTATHKSASSVEKEPQGKKCERSKTEAESYICESFRDGYECVHNAMQKKCDHPSPRDTLEKIYNHVVNDSYCETYERWKNPDRKTVEGDPSEKITCGEKPCHLKFASSEIGSSSTSGMAISNPISEGVTQQYKHVFTEEILKKPVFPISAPVSTEPAITTRIVVHSAKSRMDKMLSDDSTTVKSKAPFLDLRVFNSIMLPSLMILQYTK